MLLDLDEREAETLSQALDSRLGELARELARTEQRDPADVPAAGQ